MRWNIALQTAPIGIQAALAKCSNSSLFHGAHHKRLQAPRIRSLIRSQVSPPSAANTFISMTKLEIKLSNGTPVPALGFGAGTAWFNKAGNDSTKPLNQELIASMKSAIDVGYRHLDLAEVYGTDLESGVAIKEAGVPREQLFITTKVMQNIKDPVKSLKDSLARLQLDYVDLYLIHSPFFNLEKDGIDLRQAWEAVEETHRLGLAKHIGVSNFGVEDLEKVMSFAKIKPVANQIEYNPYLQQPELAEYCEKHGIVREAYGPLIPVVHEKDGPITPILAELAKKYEKTPGQILLRWTIQMGVIAVTTSGKVNRQKEQLQLDDFSLTPDEVQQIKEEGSKHPFRKFWTKEFLKE